jgi:hypothetical protein
MKRRSITELRWSQVVQNRGTEFGKLGSSFLHHFCIILHQCSHCPVRFGAEMPPNMVSAML